MRRVRGTCDHGALKDEQAHRLADNDCGSCADGYHLIESPGHRPDTWCDDAGAIISDEPLSSKTVVECRAACANQPECTHFLYGADDRATVQTRCTLQIGRAHV